MERSEPTLVPEWLRSTGSVTGVGSSANHFASSSLHSDVPASALPTRNRLPKSISDYDTPRSTFLDRTFSSNSRRSSISNGSTKHDKDSYSRAYSSFTRSHRDKDRDKDKERSVIGDHWDRDCSDPFGNIEMLRRSPSMVSRKQGESLPRRVSTDSKNGGNGNHNNGNVVLSGGSTVSSIQKAVFEKDFPSLGNEERQGVPDVGRVSSPGLSTAVQSLPIGNSALIGGEGWTSALAEVPMIIGSNSMGPSSVQQTVVATPSSGAPSTMAGLNMAEALAQAPPRVRTAPESSIKTQRLEELAIKQSRQLIPMTPSMSKASVLNSTDKPKPKPTVRAGEMTAVAKSGQQQPSSSHLANQSLRGGHVRSDAPKTSHVGKFLVLKPVWENGVSPTAKDVSCPTNNASSRVTNSQLAVAPSVPSGPLRSPNKPKLATVERKAAVLAPTPGSTVDKKLPFSQAQSRNDFFNLMRKKTSLNNSTTVPDSGPVASSPTTEKSGEVTKEVASSPASPHASENGGEVTRNGDTCKEAQRFSEIGVKNLSANAAVYPDEEEAAFLRSLGWEENGGEDDGLTDEEINAFYEYLKSEPFLKLCRGMQPKLPMLLESHVTSLGSTSSELSSSGSESEA